MRRIRAHTVLGAAFLIACLCGARPARSNSSEKVFEWAGEQRAGDCGQVNARLVIRSDGTAHFSSVVHTYHTHSGDYWWSSFIFQDSDGVALLSIPYRRSPRMDDGNGGPSPRYHFDFDFTFDASKFGGVARVQYGSKC